MSSFKFLRHIPKANLQLAEQALFDEMEHAAGLLQTEEDFGRSGVCHAIRACHSFLLVRGLSGQALKPLIDLIAAFEDVDRGILPELFDPKTKPDQMSDRKWSRSAAARETKIHAAACMDALMKSDVGKEEAARGVARCSDHWHRVSRGLIRPSTVTNWRDELLQQASNNRERRRFELRAAMFSQGPKARKYLEEALQHGPVLTGGVRRRPKPKT